MKYQKQLILGTLIAGIIVLGSLAPFKTDEVRAFHTEAELEQLSLLLLPPVDSSIIFPGSATCKGCHGFDVNGYAMVDFFGNDVNIHDDWKATMMANAAKDPFWRAKVSHEITLNPGFSEAIQNKCTSCHAPMGHYTAFYRGHEYYTIADLMQDTLGLDGVSCSACHMISPENLGQQHSGNLTYDTTRIMYGPYPGPFAAPMTDFVGFRPLYGPHVGQAGMCASCHTLLTEPIGPDGQLLGTTFVEQATYHEWLNSAYAEDQENITCQSCHMPVLEEPVVISANYLFLQGRSPYSRHEFAGANVFMLSLMKRYRQDLGLGAREEDFDETIAATLRLLQQESVEAKLDWMGMEADTAIFRLKLRNLAGHKFPSGYPSRRLFVEFVVQTPEGDTLFHSGGMNERHEIVNENLPFEPHYNVIRRPQDVQIYEMVAGDADHPFTVVLEHASVMSKDNRLPPRGFSVNHAVYDTTRIVGGAASDPNFNHDENGVEGNGSDELYYYIGTNGYAGPVEVKARLYYHSLPPRWVNPIFEVSTPAIDSFEVKFNSMDNTPVLVGSKTLADVVFPPFTRSKEVRNNRLRSRVWPNPADQTTYVEVEGLAGAQPPAAALYTAAGKLVAQPTQQWEQQDDLWRGRLNLSGLASGVYLYQLTDRRGKVIASGKVIKN